MANIAKQQERIAFYEQAQAQLQLEAEIALRQLVEAERQLRIEREILDEMLIPTLTNYDDFSDDNTALPLP